MRDSGIRSLRSVRHQPDGTYIADVELDIGIVIQDVNVVVVQLLEVLRLRVKLLISEKSISHRVCAYRTLALFAVTDFGAGGSGCSVARRLRMLVNVVILCHRCLLFECARIQY